MLVEKTPKREALFWEKVRKLDGENSCWLWTGARNENGYGWITVYENGKQRFYFVHKVSYEWEYGDIPEGHIVRHQCDIPLCVRPSHLITGTYKDNSNDMIERGRHVGNRLITFDDVLDIRLKRARGEDTRKLAKEYNLSPQHISNICTGKYWPNSAGPITRAFRITDETIRSVLEDLKHMSRKDCSIKYNLSKSAIEQIATGKKSFRNK